MPPLLFLLLAAAAAQTAAAAAPTTHPSPLRVPRLAPRRGLFGAAAPAPTAGYNAHLNLLSRCTRRTRAATLDHFGWGRREGVTFEQRYFVCDESWGGPGSPIFFYAGETTKRGGA